ncbi:Uu.00g141580.m01.CDS01 [Anthostomella pinea]|uniref:Uu.00g141580.m01.CDS01 n=1 Tax=Anthostomella pinea TaxID=933095 RepID=A0AAI8VRH3_9PEZI|nr:Uu.00g141580.m01.CDS01 [Anthostomella pinea]
MELAPITGSLKQLPRREREQAEGTDYTDPLEIVLGGEYTATQWVIDEEDPEGRNELILHRLEKAEVSAFEQLNRKMLQYDPSDWLSLEEVLKDEWFIKRPLEAKTVEPPRRRDTGWLSRWPAALLFAVGLVWVLTDILPAGSGKNKIDESVGAKKCGLAGGKCYIEIQSRILHAQVGSPWRAGLSEDWIYVRGLLYVDLRVSAKAKDEDEDDDDDDDDKEQLKMLPISQREPYDDGTPGRNPELWKWTKVQAEREVKSYTSRSHTRPKDKRMTGDTWGRRRWVMEQHAR